MKSIILKKLLAIAAVGSTCLLGVTLARENTNVWTTNFWANFLKTNNGRIIAIPYTNPWPTIFLTISNRPYLLFDSSCVVRVTDSEWSTLTNNYPEKIKTNTITFYGK